MITFNEFLAIDCEFQLFLEIIYFLTYFQIFVRQINDFTILKDLKIDLEFNLHVFNFKFQFLHNFQNFFREYNYRWAISSNLRGLHIF